MRLPGHVVCNAEERQTSFWFKQEAKKTGTVVKINLFVYLQGRETDKN